MGEVRPQEVRDMADTPWYQVGPSDERWPPATEPTRATPIGPVDEAPLAIYLGSRAMEVIDSQLELAPDAPFAGLLIGHPLSGPDRRFLIVTDVLPFPLTSEDEGEIRFSPRLFEELFPHWQERREGASVVGWCHAAPKRGIALSSFQRFNHHRYFPRPWQVALIIDADRHASLLYRWEGPELVPCDAFYYWNMEAEPAALLLESPLLAPNEAQLETAATAHTAAYDEKAKARNRPPLWIWLLLPLLVYALIPAAPGSIPWMRQRLGEGTDSLARLHQGLHELQIERDSLRRQVSSAAATLSPSPEEPASTSPTPALRPASNSTLPAAASAAPVEPTVEAREAPTIRDYVIQPGDTMWSISRTLLGDPYAFRRLAETNEIDDPDTIFPGQRLQLPE